MLKQPDITPEQHQILITLADMTVLEQLKVFLVDGEITELPKDPVYYRKIHKPNKKGVARWEKRQNLYRKDK